METLLRENKELKTIVAYLEKKVEELSNRFPTDKVTESATDKVAERMEQVFVLSNINNNTVTSNTKIKKEMVLGFSVSLENHTSYGKEGARKGKKWYARKGAHRVYLGSECPSLEGIQGKIRAYCQKHNVDMVTTSN